jgi:hypothetical protein
MYWSHTMSQLLQWHVGNKSTDGLVCHVVDNKTWSHIDETWPNFANEPWNLRLAISTNGFNPFFEKLCQWSTWHVYICFIFYCHDWWQNDFHVSFIDYIGGKKCLTWTTLMCFLLHLWRGWKHFGCSVSKHYILPR